MPTQAESRALAFFAGLFALGGVLRFVDTLRPRESAAEPAAETALAAQLARVDTARAAAAGGRGGSRGRRAARVASPDSGAAAPPAGVPPELAAVAGWFVRARPKPVTVGRERGSPDARGTGRNPAPAAAALPARDASALVDLDTASEADIEALPGIGPSLARRLVADRAQHGAFGSLDALGRVKGVGAVLRARLAPRVTFSGVARPE